MLIIKAIQFAADKHRDQVRRESGLPYVVHPTSVAFLLSHFKESKRHDELVVAALLHDTLEDTDTDFIEIAEEFTPLVASLVLELTSDEEEIDEIGKNSYLIKKMIGMSSYALVIKLADRLSNIMDSPSSSYMNDTKFMLKELEAGRQLTGTQKDIIEEIRNLL